MFLEIYTTNSTQVLSSGALFCVLWEALFIRHVDLIRTREVGFQALRLAGDRNVKSALSLYRTVATRSSAEHLTHIKFLEWVEYEMKNEKKGCIDYWPY